MQTFLPFADFRLSARSLDSARLNNQRNEAYVIFRAAVGEIQAWNGHPAVKMWKGCEFLLLEYAREICLECRRRGVDDTVWDKFQRLESVKKVLSAGMVIPFWIGDSRIYTSHQSNLIRKDRKHYKPQFPDVSENLPYFWPV